MRSAFFIPFVTILRKEVVRILRIWIQTLVPPAITMALYFVIFGKLIGSRIGDIVEGYSYIDFIVPGLIMMSVITNSYGNVVSSFFSAKFQKNIEEMMVAPVPASVIICGYVGGGVLRGILVGVLVLFISLFFTDLSIYSVPILASTIVLTAILFSLAGFMNALFAKKFDDVSIIPTFVLTPLTYLGGVFYSIEMLGEPWHTISLANPILYMVNAFRYGFIGHTDIDLTRAFVIIVAAVVLVFSVNLVLMRRGYGIRS
ncbi:MAG: ABC transporter permease [Spirochaetales bacterium]|nr:ABC transporter permease [Leptospiraceae bacterium]MCP5480507.1 ABC transporter permease [Spirochaetales bacterium]